MSKVADKNLNIRLPKDKYEKLKEIADKNGVPMASMVRNLIYKGMEEVERTGEPNSFLKLEATKK